MENYNICFDTHFLIKSATAVMTVALKLENYKKVTVQFVRLRTVAFLFYVYLYLFQGFIRLRHMNKLLFAINVNQQTPSSQGK